MIRSSRRDRKIKATAEVLAMISDAHPVLAQHPHFVRETDEWLWESATEFCAALDRFAKRAIERITDTPFSARRRSVTRLA
jgi:hypothetical protein